MKLEAVGGILDYKSVSTLKDASQFSVVLLFPLCFSN